MNIALENICFNYKKEKPVLKDVDLLLPQGELVLIEGYSGAGKTTLLNLIAGVVRPDQGKVYWDGKVLFEDLHIGMVDKLRPRYVGVVFSDYRLVGHLSGWDNIRLPAIVSDQNYAEKLVKYLVDVFFQQDFTKDGKDLLDRPVSTLSDGQKERVAVIRAFAVQPPFILADEMFSAIHPDLKKHLWRVVKELCRENNIGILLVSHDLLLIEQDMDFKKYTLKDHGVYEREN
jgi:ABC-type lipoprotein export system ATPase subunit